MNTEGKFYQKMKTTDMIETNFYLTESLKKTENYQTVSKTTSGIIAKDWKVLTPKRCENTIKNCHMRLFLI